MSKYPLEVIDYKHVLTQDERNEKAMQLAEKHIDIDTLKDEKKSMNTSYQAKIDQKMAEVNLFSIEIKDGYVTLTIQAEKRKNFFTHQWEWYNPNTGELLKTKPFEGRDWQMSVDDQDDFEERKDPFNEDGEVQDVDHSEVLMIGPGIIEPEEIDGEDPDSGPDDEETEEPKKGRKKPKKGGDQ